jgi:hypothetical protein
MNVLFCNGCDDGSCGFWLGAVIFVPAGGLLTFMRVSDRLGKIWFPPIMIMEEMGYAAFHL